MTMLHPSWYWLLGLLPIVCAGVAARCHLRQRQRAAHKDKLITHRLETLYLSDDEQRALTSDEISALTDTLAAANADSFYVMVEQIRQRSPTARDHLIHALDVVEDRPPVAQLLFGFLLVEKAMEIMQAQSSTEAPGEIARAQELARLGIDALQGLRSQLETLWARDVYYRSLIIADNCKHETYTLSDRATHHAAWLTRLQGDLGRLPWTARTLCQAYSAQWHGNDALCLDIAQQIADAAEPGTACSGIIVFAHDLIFYHRRFIKGQSIDPTTYYTQPAVKHDILSALKKWYAIKEKRYDYQRSLANDRITNALLFLGYPHDALKALLRSHPADTIWCIKKTIHRTGLHQHILKAIADNDASARLNYLR